MHVHQLFWYRMTSWIEKKLFSTTHWRPSFFFYSRKRFLCCFPLYQIRKCKAKYAEYLPMYSGRRGDPLLPGWILERSGWKSSGSKPLYICTPYMHLWQKQIVDFPIISAFFLRGGVGEEEKKRVNFYENGNSACRINLEPYNPPRVLKHSRFSFHAVVENIDRVRSPKLVPQQLLSTKIVVSALSKCRQPGQPVQEKMLRGTKQICWISVHNIINDVLLLLLFSLRPKPAVRYDFLLKGIRKSYPHSPARVGSD